METSAEQQRIPKSPQQRGALTISLIEQMNNICRNKRAEDLPGFFSNLIKLQLIKTPDGKPVTHLPAVKNKLAEFGQDPKIKEEMIAHLKASNQHDPKTASQTISAATLLGLSEEEVSQSLPPQPKRVDRRSFLRLAAGLTAATIGAPLLTSSNAANSLIPLSSTKTPSTPPETTRPSERLILVKEILKPFIEEAKRRRQEQANKDPEYYHRVDHELNENRLNFVLLGYGEEHGQSYQDYSSSISIYSYDEKSGNIAAVSLSRDIRVPELRGKLPPNKFEVIRNVYFGGGFDLTRRVLENATGLATDFQILVKDTAIPSLVDNVSGSVTVSSAKSHEVKSFLFGGKQYPEGQIPAGEYKIKNGEQAIYFILPEDKNPTPKEDDRAYRKNQLLRAIYQKIGKNIQSNLLATVTGAANFVSVESLYGNLKLDFSLGLFSDLVGKTTEITRKTLIERKDIDSSMPVMDMQKEMVVSDDVYGDGGTTTAGNIKAYPKPGRHDSQTVLAEIAANKLPEWMQIPNGGNPNAKDLVTGYYASLRELIKKRLTS